MRKRSLGPVASRRRDPYEMTLAKGSEAAVSRVARESQSALKVFVQAETPPSHGQGPIGDETTAASSDLKYHFEVLSSTLLTFFVRTKMTSKKSTTSTKWTAVLISTLGLLALAPVQVQGGSGAFDGSSYTFCVAVRFDASPDVITRIKSVFTAASQVFNDATDGQQRFGTIKIVPNLLESDDAEFYIHQEEGRADAPPDGYGVRGQHVNLYYPDDFAASIDSGAFTIAHEMGHHAFGLRDEYSDDKKVACSDHTDDPNLSFCLMDNYFAYGARKTDPSARPTLKEFCVHDVSGALSHDPNMDTRQSKLNKGQSCWETIATHPTRPAQPPNPGQLPNPLIPALQLVDFAENSGFGTSVVIVIDRSGSMADDGKLEYAQAGAIAYVNSLIEGDSVAVVSFACDGGTVDMDLTVIDKDGRVKSTANNAIQGLEADGSTGISDGIGLAVNLLVSAASRPCREKIVLLTDGDWNCGESPVNLIPLLQKEGISCFALGVGEGLSTGGLTDLQTLAKGTSGQFWASQSPLSTVSTFLGLSAGNVNKRQLGSLVGGEVSTGSGNVTDPVKVGPLEAMVEVNATEVSFLLVFNSSAANLTIQDPTGKTLQVTGYNFTRTYSNFSVAQAPAPLAPNLTAVNQTYNLSSTTTVELGPNFVSVTVQKPVPGTYTVSGVQVFNASVSALTPAPAPAPKPVGFQARQGDPPPKPQLELFVYGRNPLGAQLNALVVNNDTVYAPDPVVIEANLLFSGRLVLNATVTADVFFPNGTRAGNFTLLDNGNNNDSIADDGYYTGRFSDYGADTDGSYTFKLTARSGQNASIYPGESLFAATSPPASVPGGVPDFVRQQTVSAVVADTPVDFGQFSVPSPPRARSPAPAPARAFGPTGAP
ncbi:calcium-activated chloride channel family member 4 [Klebsormidium nitens]|uniref:Calcium-activated chloride channel family member 4 n=1 Tax=Klebsormidium nitens TaxID=105231 RepID=A0A1Y1HR97_KLENI|nr:calcium-activated chloride channel family member 4 [Klebsormidium nitens]|eukprot:GAQ79116.1 calcium-activated chloride channel family member 4 [Klebsormidium nitens]